jgi:uncharacterized protein YkwD
VRISRSLAVTTAMLAVAVPAAEARASVTQGKHRLGSARRLVLLINVERRRAGLRPLRFYLPLARAARSHSRDMLQRGYFGHGEAVTRIAQYLTAPRLIGEDLAWGTGLYGTPEGTLAMWLASPPHRDVLMDPRFRRIGIGGAHGQFLGNANARIYTADFSG